VLDALGLEALDEQVRRLPLRHAHVLSLQPRNFRPVRVSGYVRSLPALP
jgi:hypothetical protein